MKTQDSPADSFVLPQSGNQSEAVRAAQQKLVEMRRSLGIEPRGRNTDSESYPLASTPPCSPAPRRFSYHSEPLTRHLRAVAARHVRQQAAKDRGWLESMTNGKSRITKSENAPSSQPPSSPAATTNDELRITKQEDSRQSSFVSQHSSLVKVYPDVALGMLRTKAAAAGRVWLLLRHFDAAGGGRIAAGDAARLLTGDGSPGRICGRRQLDNLLRAGDGLFWERDTARDGEWLRLRSAARVAAGLGVARLGGSPVAVPLSALTGNIGQARAHLYASFHSGRTRTDLLSGEKRSRGPISRASLCKLSGAATNSQRNYERRARVGRRAAIALGPLAGAADEHETAWERGRAMFRLRDGRGRYGRPGAVYLAWQLPNEYTGPHDTLPRGRQKRLNRSLADLFHNGMTGNGGGEIRNYELGITNEGAGGGQYSVSSGQWPEKEEVNARTPGRQDANSSCASAPLRPCVELLRSSPVVRQYYASAKAAHLARHNGERYWRHGGVWLWQPQLRVSSDELRVKQTTDDRPQTTIGILALAAPNRPDHQTLAQRSKLVISSDDRSRHS